MSEVKTKIEKAGDLAKDVFLAQLGLAGKAYEQAESMVKKTEEKYKETETKLKDTYNKREEIFNGLIARGEKVQSDAKAKLEESKTEATTKLKEAKSEVVAKFESLKSETVDARIKELRSNLETGLEKVKAKVSRKPEVTAEPAAAEVAAS